MLEDELFDKEKEIQNFKNTLTTLNIFKNIRKKIKLDKEIIYLNIKYNLNELPLYYSASTTPRRSSVRFSTIPKKYININNNNKNIPYKGYLLIKYPDPPLFYN